MKLSIIFGGRSYEHEISIVSAISLTKKLANIKHCIFLDYAGEFYAIPLDAMRSSTFSSGTYKKYKKLSFTRGDFECSSLWGRRRLGVERVLSLIHGGDGEDGILSSLLEFYGIPFVGPRKEACVLSYDKELTKLYAMHRGVKVLPFVIHSLENPPKDLERYPSILKPARLGSSLGVSVVRDGTELGYGLDQAFEYDEKILIEPFYEGVKEYNLAGCKDGRGDFVFSIVEEPKKAELLDFEDKYLDFARTEQAVRAEISSELEAALRENFTRLYEGCFEGSLIRCDFFVIEGEVYLNEINPIPGSMANYLFDDFQSLLGRIGLPNPRQIRGDYRYIHKIQRAKGKA